ncbi:putative MFS family arabinose efflux permease [Kibdelosporangium phytohabitans]|nr:putative MFS family arabinose efflux permease [Kibdelosporangium phytohabitans]
MSAFVMGTAEVVITGLLPEVAVGLEDVHCCCV